MNMPKRASRNHAREAAGALPPVFSAAEAPAPRSIAAVSVACPNRLLFKRMTRAYVNSAVRDRAWVGRFSVALGFARSALPYNRGESHESSGEETRRPWTLAGRRSRAANGHQ